VVNILREEGLETGPSRGPGTWCEFVKQHAATLWASDFISVRTLTSRGIVDLYLLFFIHIGTRRVIVSAPTASPNADWVVQQARNASFAMAEWNLKMSHLLIDHDRKYTKAFDAVWESEGAEVQRVGPRAPNLNAFAERWVQTLRTECLDRFVVCGERHLSHLVNEFVTYYNHERPHQSKDNRPLTITDATTDAVQATSDTAMSQATSAPATTAATSGTDATNETEPVILRFPTANVKCRERLGGLLKHYYRDAA
jgi:putative transposase